ncbi:Protein FAM76A [Blattella germanica]|nr:Protein FAM76A [Blattella germanica]
MNMSALFACSRCFSRHPFEELSSGQQLCKECRGAFPVVKCTYCRSEFQQTNKGSPSAICKKCETNVKQFGKPSACEYCNIIAAFIGNKCQRCTNSEKKYGPPVTCEQCKQKCAFDRKDEDKKVDGKLLCWLCTLSYKRALAKTKQSDADRRAHIKLAAQRAAKNKEHGKHKGHNKRPHRVDVTKLNQPSSDKDGGEGGPPAKAARGGSGAGNNRGDPHDPNSSDHVVAMTQLKEQIASLQKQLNQKDSQLLSKDKMITELKAKHFTVENELRNKMKNMQKEYETKVETFSIKIKSLQKEVATLSKSGKKQLSVAARELGGGSGGAGSGSGTDSPSLA